MPDKPVTIFAVIPVHNRKRVTLGFLQKFTRLQDRSFRLKIIVVDDGSTDGTAASISIRYPQVTVLHGSGNLWWSGATNMGVRYALQAGANFILTINDDIDFDGDFLANIVETAHRFPRSIICALVCHEDNKDTVLSAGRYRSGFLGYKTPAKYQNEPAATIRERWIESELESGYAMLIPQNLFHHIGLFDEKYFPHHIGDMDFVLRSKRHQYRVVVDTHARIYTTIGANYIVNLIVNGSLKHVLLNLIDIKSTIYWKTRVLYALRHAKPKPLATIAVFHYLARMVGLLLILFFFPKSVITKIAGYRYGRAFYSLRNTNVKMSRPRDNR